MIVEHLVPAYQDLLTRYLTSGDHLEQEAVLMGVDALARSLLPQRVTMDDMLALHTRAKCRLADVWQAAPLGSTEHLAWHRLARGDGIPVMVALLLPQQIEEHRQAEKRWQTEHDRLAAIFDQTADLVLMFDPQGQIEYVNGAFSRATGWRLHEAREAPRQVWQARLPALGTEHIQARQRRKDGSWFTAAWTLSAILDEEGELQGHVGIGRDVTAQQQIEEGLRQNDRLRAIATLAAGVAHDFNNALGSIMGLTDLCLSQVDADSQQARSLGGIQQAAHHAAGLVRQLLSFAHERPPHRASVAVADWLRRIEPLLRASLPKGCTLSIQTPDGNVRAMFDAPQMEQVLLNLVKNAGQALQSQGGTVRLEADLAHPAAAHPTLVLRVIDHGPGIDANVLPRIFDPFFTTKPVGEGTGLGLSAAYGIVRHHQGTITASSAPGAPTIFTVEIPAQAASEPASTGEPEAQARLASWYELDEHDVIVAVSPDWDAAALDNHAPQATAQHVLGCPLSTFIHGQEHLALILQAVHLARATGDAQRQFYRCDAPQVQRRMELTLTRQGPDRVRVSHRLIAQRLRRARTDERH